MVGLGRGKSRVSLLAAMTILVAGVASCYPGDINTVGEADLVLTFFDSTADFASIGTYAMPDSIVRITDEGGSSAANPVSMPRSSPKSKPSSPLLATHAS